MSLMASFCAFVLSLDVLNGIWDLIESVSKGFPSYFSTSYSILSKVYTDEDGIKYFTNFIVCPPVRELISFSAWTISSYRPTYRCIIITSLHITITVQTCSVRLINKSDGYMGKVTGYTFRAQLLCHVCF